MSDTIFTMCCDVKTNLEAQLSSANRKGDLQAIKEIKESLVPLTDLQINTPQVSAKTAYIYRPFSLTSGGFNLGFGSSLGKGQKTA